MERVLLVVDDNVNARIVCQVLLDSRGEPPTLYTRGAVANGSALGVGRSSVVLMDARLWQKGDIQELQGTLASLRNSESEPVGLLVVTDKPERLREVGLDHLVNGVLRPNEVGGRLLAEIDALRTVSIPFSHGSTMPQGTPEER
ncbi:hypothetical protein HRbin30_00261 [bacterium HR30]|nr:hypothetical protein HRbin30_00261 [bacterium HR30]